MTTPPPPASREAAPVTLYLSSESLLLTEAEVQFRQTVLPEDPAAMNHRSVYGWDADLGSVLEFLQTLPFLADRRLLVIREIQAFKGWRDLVEYMKDPNPTSFLLLTSSEWKKKDAGCRAIAKHAELREFRRPYGRALTGWVRKRFRDRGKAIDDQLAEVVVSVAGENLAALAAEIDKVSLHAADRSDITDQDLDVVMPGGVSTIFTLLDALGDGRSREALVAMQRLLEAEGKPEVIIHMIARHYRQLLRGRALVEAGASPEAAARELGIAYRNLQEKFARHVRRADRAKIQAALRTVSECDRAIKTSGIPERVLLDRLTLDLLA